MAFDRAHFNTLIDDDGSGLTGSVWNKAQIDQLIVDIDRLGAYCQVATNGHSIAHLTPTALAFHIEDSDPLGMHAGVSSAISAPYTGVYVLHAMLAWQYSPTGVRGIAFRHNGGTMITPQHNVIGLGTSGITASQNLLTAMPLNQGDYIEVIVTHDAGGPLFVSAGGRFTVFRIF